MGVGGLNGEGAVGKGGFPEDPSYRSSVIGGGDGESDDVFKIQILNFKLLKRVSPRDAACTACGGGAAATVLVVISGLGEEDAVAFDAVDEAVLLGDAP